MAYQPVSLESLLTHQGWALKVARRLVREEGEAEDLVQRTWMAALQRPPQSETGARAWIRKVILNLARERHRRGQARLRFEASGSPREAEAPDALETLSRAEIHGLLSERLMRLEEPYRTVVLQRFYEDLSSVEIAQRLGIPAGTVRWRLKMGLDQLRAELDRRSQGDRTRWVSALLAFLRPVHDASRPGSRAPAGPSRVTVTLVQAAGWVALLGIGVATWALWPAASDRTALAALAADRAEDGHAAKVESPTGVSQRVQIDGEASPAPPASRAPSEQLTIRVEDRSGAPMAGASVLVARLDGFEPRATTDAEGRAQLEVRPGDRGALGLEATRGRVSIRALAEGHVASVVLHVAPPFDAQHEVRLVVGGPDEVLRGRVLSPEGEPVAGATVAWFVPMTLAEPEHDGDFASPGYLAVQSDETGAFALAHRPHVAGNIGCFARGFATLSLALDSRTSNDPLILRLARGATVAGTVRDRDGAPAAGVSVSCETVMRADEWVTGLPRYVPGWRGFGESTRSDEGGRFLLKGVECVNERVLWAVDEAGGRMATTTLVLADDAVTRWDPELDVRPGLRLRLEDEAGRPLAGWLAYFRRPSLGDAWWVRRIAADANGRVQVLDCPNERVYLDVFQPLGIGGSRAWYHLTPSLEEQRIVVDTRSTTRITGRLVDSSGAPELRGELAVGSLETTLPTRLERDADGAFDQTVAPGRYTLVLQLPDTALSLLRFKVAPGETRDLGALIAPSLGKLRINGAALFQGGERIPDFTLSKLSDRPRENGHLLVARGTLEDELVLDVFPGRYELLYWGSLDTAPRIQHLNVRAYEETLFQPEK